MSDLTRRARIEKRLGIVFGAYLCRPDNPYRNWPIWIGPIGEGVGADGRGYWRSWRNACGFEVGSLGFNVYLARR